MTLFTEAPDPIEQDERPSPCPSRPQTDANRSPGFAPCWPGNGLTGVAVHILGTVSALVQPRELHRLSIEEYHRLLRAGGLDEAARVELIDGLVVDMSPRTPEHENAIRWLIRWLVECLDHSRWQFMIAGSLTIGTSEPEPDVAILDLTPPAHEHPSRALLVIEVAVSSRDRDLGAKPLLYAQTVQEYWVVDLEHSCVVVHRQPEVAGYGDVTVVQRGEFVSPGAVKLGELPTDELFAAAFAE